MDTITPYEWGLTIPNIRSLQPGLPEQTYVILENLDAYIEKIVTSLNKKVKKATRLGGWSSINVKLDTEDNQSYVIKIDPWVGVLVTSATFYTLVKERYPQQKVPRLVKLDESKEVIPHEFLVLEYIEHDSTSTFSTEDKYGAGRLFGDFLKDIHKIRVEGYGSPQSTVRWKFKTWAEALRNFLNSRYFSKASEIFDQETIDFIMQLPTRAEPSESMLLHADVSIENCLFKRENDQLQIAAIIDPDTTGGDPYWDLAIGIGKNDDFSRGIVESYLGVDAEKELNSRRFLILSLIYLFWIIGWRQTMGLDISEYKTEFEEQLAKLKAII